MGKIYLCPKYFSIFNDLASLVFENLYRGCRMFTSNDIYEADVIFKKLELR